MMAKFFFMTFRIVLQLIIVLPSWIKNCAPIQKMARVNLRQNDLKDISQCSN
jgi:hypothetical protein